VKRPLVTAAALLFASTSTLVIAQTKPEDLRPPGYAQPAPAPAATRTPRPAPSPDASTAPAASGPAMRPGEVVQSLPSGTGEPAPALGTGIDLAKLPTLEQLEAMSTDDLDDLFGLKPKVDIPAAAQRGMERVGVIAPDEGGLPIFSLANQPAGLVRAALAGTKGPLVSRWGHILLRRTLASRLTAPAGMDPAEFAALRAGLLNRMGEFGVARALVQDVDTVNYSPALTNAAFSAYLGSADILGICPAIRLARGTRDDGEWRMAAAICAAYAGEATNAGSDLRRLTNSGRVQRIDGLLAQRYAGAAGDGRQAVTIEWDGITQLTPWRFALANAVGADVPKSLLDAAPPSYDYAAAQAPMLTGGQRILAGDTAAARGILSSQALVDLYSQLGDEEADDALAERVQALRTAYVGADAASRLGAMKSVWGTAEGERYGRFVLTAAAAARLEPAETLATDAGDIIASILTAGYDRDAGRWAAFVEAGSQGWALLTLGLPRAQNATSGQFEDFSDADASAGKLKSRLLLASAAGLGRMSEGAISAGATDFGIDFERRSKWTQAIDAAASGQNQAMVVILAALGMQGNGWQQMTPVHLYHIVKALDAVGLGAEARMIAAEAVARA